MTTEPFTASSGMWRFCGAGPFRIRPAVSLGKDHRARPEKQHQQHEGETAFGLPQRLPRIINQVIAEANRVDAAEVPEQRRQHRRNDGDAPGAPTRPEARQRPRVNAGEDQHVRGDQNRRGARQHQKMLARRTGAPDFEPPGPDDQADGVDEQEEARTGSLALAKHVDDDDDVEQYQGGCRNRREQNGASFSRRRGHRGTGHRGPYESKNAAL